MGTICVSRLLILLKERQMTVLSLQQQLAQKGHLVSKKTLHRLASMQPLKKVDLTIAGEICLLLQVGLDDLFVIRPQKGPGEKTTFTPKKKARMRLLLELARKRPLTSNEKQELNQLVDEEWESAISAAENKVMATYPDWFKRETPVEEIRDETYDR